MTWKVSVKNGDKEVPMNAFVERLVVNLLDALVRSLSGLQFDREIVIRMEPTQDENRHE